MFRETKTGPVRSVTLIKPALEVFEKLPLRLDTLQIFLGSKKSTSTIRLMGWKSYSMLKRYTHLTVEHISDAQDRLEEMFA